jgi:hypothetical protein
MDKQDKRERIILTVAAHLKNADPTTDHKQKLIGLDALLCEAIGIDQETNPPEFILVP